MKRKEVAVKLAERVKKSAERVKACIYENFKNQSEFARVTGLTTAQVANICTGTRKLSTDNARKFAKLFNVRMEYLLAEDDFKTEDDLRLYNKKLYKEPFELLDEHEQAITLRQLIFYEMVLPWLIQLYDLDDNAYSLSQKDYFKLAEFLDHEMQHVVQGYFNIKSNNLANPINVKSDNELFERYTRDCLKNKFEEVDGFKSFGCQSFFSYGPCYYVGRQPSNFDSLSEIFKKLVQLFSEFRGFAYNENLQALNGYFRDSAVKKALGYIKAEYREQAENDIRGVFLYNSPEVAHNYLLHDPEEIEALFDKFNSLGYLIESDDLELQKQRFCSIFNKNLHLYSEALNNGNSNKTR